MISAPRRVWCRVEPHPYPGSRSRETWAFPAVKASRSDPGVSSLVLGSIHMKKESYISQPLFCLVVH